MKRKIISLILALTFIFSLNLTALADINVFIQPKLLMEYTFDDDVLDLPQGWQPYNICKFISSEKYSKKR